MLTKGKVDRSMKSVALFIPHAQDASNSGLRMMCTLSHVHVVMFVISPEGRDKVVLVWDSESRVGGRSSESRRARRFGNDQCNSESKSVEYCECCL